MKAWVRRRYGSVSELALVDVPKPTPADDEALVRVEAASLNRSDWEALVGSPFYVRMGGLFKPRHPIIGSDFAGRVEAIGATHTVFDPGDEICGDILSRPGACAEYVCVRGGPVARKPQEVSFEAAASLPQAGVIALQAMRGRAVPDARIAIVGAGGSVGGFAIQLAKRSGSEVTCVDGPQKAELLRSLGADHVVDHTESDFTRSGARYDFILDVLATRSIRAYLRALRPGGVALVVGGPVRRMLAIAVLGRVIKRIVGRRVGVLIARPNRDDLERVVEMVCSGELRTPIEIFSFERVPEAMQRLGDGLIQGKAVISIRTRSSPGAP